MDLNKKNDNSINTTTHIKKAGMKKALKKGAKGTKNVVKKIVQWTLNIILTLLLILTMSGAIIGVTFYNYINEYLVDPDYDIEYLETNLNQTTKLYYTDEYGNDIELEDQRIYGNENRFWVSYDRLPKTLIDAFVSIEDERFWSHSGVDWKRTFGAVVEFVKGNKSYGGSTITQQLIKNITKEDDTTIQRKVTEIFRALNLSKKRSREEILEMYLNTIHLSRSNYGVQAAANYYFDKDVSELSLVECAALASIPKSPTKYDPIRNPEHNKDRRNVVLDKMAELGCITEEEAIAAKNTELVINRAVIDDTISSSNSYFKDALIEQVISDLSREYGYSREYASNYIYSGGLQIYTTMDPKIQKTMEEILSDPSTFQRVTEGIQPETAMVVMDPYTGYVKGIVGGREKTGDRDLNRATQSKRQIGSAIKPLTVYSPAMELGLINYATVIDDTPVKYDEKLERYWPKNAPNRYDGYININRAVEVSKNTTAVKVLESLTTDYSYNFAKTRLHLDSLAESDKDVAPLAMGGLTYGLTVYEVTAAYSVFPNKGVYTTPRMYTKILKSDGTILLENGLEQNYAISADTAEVMTKILQNVVSNGTASGITLDKYIDVAGKTGSTNDDKDRYFAGFTPYYVGACWFGYDTPKYLGKFNSNPAMIAWEKVMTAIHKDFIDEAAAGERTLKTFDFNDLEKVEVCLDSGLLPGPYCHMDLRNNRIVNAYFSKGTAPVDTCDRHMLVKLDSTNMTVATPYCPESYCMEVAFVKNEDRSFSHNIPITDAQYTARSISEYIPTTGSYYNGFLAEGEYTGYSDGVQVPRNSYCTVHTQPDIIPDNFDDYPDDYTSIDSNSDNESNSFLNDTENVYDDNIVLNDNENTVHPFVDENVFSN